MAKFELNIYGNDDEVVKTYETNKVRWGVYLQALKLSEELDDKNAKAQFDAISEFVKKIFPDLTDKDLELADADDVINTFKQLINSGAAIGGGNAKNVKGTGKKK